MPLLSEKDRENIIRLLREDKPLPEMYKSALFPSEDKEYTELTKVYQLVYQGKKRKEDVIAETLAAPLQEMRAFNAENPFADGWRNMLIFGDNLMALKSIYEDHGMPSPSIIFPMSRSRQPRRRRTNRLMIRRPSGLAPKAEVLRMSINSSNQVNGVTRLP